MSKKLSRFIVPVLALLSLVFGMVAHAQGTADIAVLLPDSASSARWEADDRRFFAQAFEAAGVTYSIVNAEGDARVQLTQAEQAITNGAKVLLMVNLDSASGAAIIELARANGVAIIDYDRLTIEGPGADFYVSFDGEAVGRLQGEGIVAAVEAAGIENPRVAVLNGSPTDNNATLFKNGYDSVINPLFESGAWTEVADQSVPDWDNQQALVIFEQMLTDAAGGIDAAVAANDGLAGAVIAALQNQGLPFIPVTGQDATVGGIQNILAGRQSMSVYKAIKAEAEAAAALAIALVKGEDTSSLVSGSVNNGTNDIPAVLLVPVSVTKDNIAETVIADGFRTWEEICVGEFEQYCPPAEERAMGGETMVEGSIAVLLPDSASSARWEADDRRFFAQAFEAAGVEYSIVNAEGDARVQLTQAEQAITNGARVLLMVNLDSASGAAIIELARANGVAIIDYDRLTIEGPGADFYVSFDGEAVGRLQGEGIVAAVEAAGIENPRVAVLNGSPTDNNATLFKNGYDSVINPLFESGAWTEVADQSVPDWDNQQALVIFEQMLTDAAGGIDAAVAANDGLAGAVIAALQNQGLPFIPVTGQDATVGGIQNILAGRQSMSVYKAIKAEAEAAAALAIALLKGEDTSGLVSGAVNNGTNDIPSVLLVPVSVTADNIAETVIADGFRTWEEICVGEFEQYCPADR
ncbi:MAG: substrate-binding domain-containing protein [Anaerolineae bacterium]|nr:substrate-binding domain-containing protein [Anaerolineae bacterium]